MASSNACLSSDLDLRNFENWPCGRTTILVNWFKLSRTISDTCFSTSLTASHDLPAITAPWASISARLTEWLFLVLPVSESFICGLRVILYLMPSTSNSSVTRAFCFSGAEFLLTPSSRPLVSFP